MCKQNDRKIIRQAAVTLNVYNIYIMYLLHDDGTTHTDDDETFVCEEGHIPRANFQCLFVFRANARLTVTNNYDMQLASQSFSSCRFAN